MPSQLLEEWLKDENYQHVLRSLDVVAVGIEGLEVLIHLFFDQKMLICL